MNGEDGGKAAHTRRPRYPGKNPRRFHEKYKELNPERYAADVQKVLASGKTPAGTHRPIMVDEVLALPSAGARRRRGRLHARRRRPCAGDPRARAAGRTPDRARRRSARAAAHGSAPARGRLRRRRRSSRATANFAGLPQVLAAEGLAARRRDPRGPRRVVDAARQSRSRLQLQGAGPARHADEPVARRARVAAARAPERGEARARCSTENADEPHARLIASLLKQQPRRRRRTPSNAWCAPGSPRRCRTWRRPT